MGACRRSWRGASPSCSPRASSSATSAAPSAPAPSEGYPAAHRSEQERIVLTALGG